VKAFFDTNVLVYLFDGDAPAKKTRARELLAESTSRGETVLSTQVLQEFYVTVTRKLATPLDAGTARAAVEAFAALTVVTIGSDTVIAAARRGESARLSFWDALIVQAAVEGGAGTLYSEDLQDGYETDGLVVRNPFAASAPAPRKRR
jgi:predicted nucleic acid-binding protein